MRKTLAGEVRAAASVPEPACDISDISYTFVQYRKSKSNNDIIYDLSIRRLYDQTTKLKSARPRVVARPATTLPDASADIAAISRALDSSPDGIAILIDNDGRPRGVSTAETLRVGGAGYVPATTVPAASVIEDALALAKETSCPFCVVDENGLLVGAASQSTILKAIARPGGRESQRRDL